MTPRLQHGALAALPLAGQLIEARRQFDAAATTTDQKAEAARVMIRLGTAFDQGRARAWLRDQGLRP